jgi:hypothetical protein
VAAFEDRRNAESARALDALADYVDEGRPKPSRTR